MKEQNYPSYTLTNMMINYISDIKGTRTYG